MILDKLWFFCLGTSVPPQLLRDDTISLLVLDNLVLDLPFIPLRNVCS